jgi:hypothetical protein
MYKCLSCGHIFDEGEQAYWNEPRGEWSERYDGCPLCKQSYEKTVRCKICESEHLRKELHGDVCLECIDEYRKDPEMCYNISKAEKENIKINAFLATVFDENEIEHILYEIVKSEKGMLDCSKFIDSDIYWFGERLAEEMNG